MWQRSPGGIMQPQDGRGLAGDAASRGSPSGRRGVPCRIPGPEDGPMNRATIISLAAAFLFLAGDAPARAAEAPATKPPVEIGGARAVAGEKVRGALKVAEDADGTP